MTQAARFRELLCQGAMVRYRTGTRQTGQLASAAKWELAWLDHLTHRSRFAPVKLFKENVGQYRALARRKNHQAVGQHTFPYRAVDSQWGQ